MQRQILIAPLDWGLGHATRCIPIIKYLLRMGINVHLASNGNALKILQLEFPDLETVHLPAYNAKYYRPLPFMLGIFFQLPKFLLAIFREKKIIRSYCKKNKIEATISDNRYGCRSNDVHSIFIGHQMNILMPPYLTLLQPLVNFFNWNLIQKFDEIWIPDDPKFDFTGIMTNPSPAGARKIGLLSRFTKTESETVYDLAIILSGPEPQRTRLEKKILEQLKRESVRSILVRGLPKDTRAIETPGHVQCINYLDADSLQQVIAASDLVICRSGYSSVMDLAVMSKKAAFIPTPGQTEQEYLARNLEERKIAYFQSQNSFDLELMLIEAKKYNGFQLIEKEEGLMFSAIEEILR